ncbi:hypothetical protein PCE1_004235 [Barthelona sp. PCE]
MSLFDKAAISSLGLLRQSPSEEVSWISPSASCIYCIPSRTRTLFQENAHITPFLTFDMQERIVAAGPFKDKNSFHIVTECDNTQYRGMRLHRFEYNPETKLYDSKTVDMSKEIGYKNYHLHQKFLICVSDYYVFVQFFEPDFTNGCYKFEKIIWCDINEASLLIGTLNKVHFLNIVRNTVFTLNINNISSGKLTNKHCLLTNSDGDTIMYTASEERLTDPTIVGNFTPKAFLQKTPYNSYNCYSFNYDDDSDHPSFISFYENTNDIRFKCQLAPELFGGKMHELDPYDTNSMKFVLTSDDLFCIVNVSGINFDKNMNEKNLNYGEDRILNYFRLPMQYCNLMHFAHPVRNELRFDFVQKNFLFTFHNTEFKIYLPLNNEPLMILHPPPKLKAGFLLCETPRGIRCSWIGDKHTICTVMIKENGPEDLVTYFLGEEWDFTDFHIVSAINGDVCLIHKEGIMRVNPDKNIAIEGETEDEDEEFECSYFSFGHCPFETEMYHSTTFLQDFRMFKNVLFDENTYNNDRQLVRKVAHNLCWVLDHDTNVLSLYSTGSMLFSRSIDYRKLFNLTEDNPTYYQEHELLWVGCGTNNAAFITSEYLIFFSLSGDAIITCIPDVWFNRQMHCCSSITVSELGVFYIFDYASKSVLGISFDSGKDFSFTQLNFNALNMARTENYVYFMECNSFNIYLYDHYLNFKKKIQLFDHLGDLKHFNCISRVSSDEFMCCDFSDDEDFSDFDF